MNICTSAGLSEIGEREEKERTEREREEREGDSETVNESEETEAILYLRSIP